MGDATPHNVATKSSGTTKPRLSLLSSKQQAVVRVKSEDPPDHQPQQHVTILSDATNQDVMVDTFESSSYGPVSESQQPNAIATNPSTTDKLLVNGQQSDAKQQHARPSNHVADDDDNVGDNINRGNNMNISKEDLMRLLSLLKSELQSKEIALAAIKCEQLKRLLNPVEISRSSLANTYIELQDRYKSRDVNNNSNDKAEQTPSASNSNSNSNLAKGNESTSRQQQQKTKEQQDGEESLNILNTLLELLDRHPLLALPRDSIYCLDYNCNEVSTKNYLNLKIQHLDNLINQHRRYRYHMNERLRRSEQRYLDLARELELERSIKFDADNSLYRISGRSILLKHIEQLKEVINKEKKDKEAIVMTLLNELLDERERNETLIKELADHENQKKKRAGEEEKLLTLETELNNLNLQLKKQSMVFKKDKNELQSKVAKLEAENKRLKQLVDQERESKPLQAKSPSNTIATNNQTIPAAARSNETSAGKQAAKVASPAATASKLSNAAPNAATRSSTSGGGSVIISKSSPPAKSSANLTSNGSASAQQRTPRSTTSSTNPQGDSDKTTLASQPTTINSGQAVQQRSTITTTTATTVPSTVARGLAAGSNTAGQTPVRIQPLFKSASVSSTNQQVRNLKTSTSSVVGGGGNSPNMSTPARSSSGGQLLTKPQVPAKPAQLLDQQRKSTN